MVNGSEIEGMLLTQEDIIHDLGQFSRVLERLQRKVKLALNRSIVDVSHHGCDAVVPPPIVLADGQLRLNPLAWEPLSLRPTHARTRRCF